MQSQPKNPLHGINLKTILETLVAEMGFDGLAAKIKIKCFMEKPSLSSSLVFLRKTPWARSKVENLYLRSRKHSK
jgi:uncharacterized protein (DUF2132 family)